MKLYKLFVLICFPLAIIASDREKEENKKLKALKVAMLLDSIKHCSANVAGLSEEATEVDCVQAYAQGFYKSIPEQLPDDIKRKMKFQFILLYNVHSKDVSDAKIQCSRGLIAARIGAATFTETTAKKLVDSIISENEERFEMASNDRWNKEVYEQGPLPRFLGLTYENFIQNLAKEASRIQPDTLHYHDVAQELRYLQDQQSVASVIEQYPHYEIESLRNIMHCELLAGDKSFVRQ